MSNTHCYFLITALLFITSPLYAQNIKASISGSVHDNNEALIGVTIRLQPLSKGVVSDINGRFAFNSLKPGEYTIKLSMVGYEELELTVRLNEGEQKELNLQMRPSQTALNELYVYAKSEATLIREQAYAIEVVDTEDFKNLSTNANDILRTVSGVNIRQSGGVGSEFNLSLNGLSGNQVRIFLDGIPMDYFGSSLSLNNFSANLINRIEVYKGVVPIHLSSDALGGAINVVTTNTVSNFIDASVHQGSFETQSGSLNGQFHDKKTGFTTRVRSFFNQSANNYRVPIRLVDFTTGKEQEDFTSVRRFHDAYESRMIWVESGFMKTRFADQLLIGGMYSDNYDEVQQPENAIGEAKVPYGQVHRKEQKYITNLSYIKNGLLNDRLNLNAYMVGVFAEGISVDTSNYSYNWFGERVARTDAERGEIENRKTLLTLETQNFLGNFNAEFTIAPNHNLAANFSANILQLQGSDLFKNQNNTQFANPNTVRKQVSGLSYTLTGFQSRFKATTFSKFYQYQINSIQTDYQGNEQIDFKNKQQQLGFGLSTTYEFDKIQLKASYENATRYPELVELFGDGLNIVSNPALEPEQSHNYNIGAIYTDRLDGFSWYISTNTFIRDASQFIIPQIQGIKVTHINNGQVLAKGVDFSSSISFENRWRFNFNATYLDLRDNNRFRNNTSANNPLFGVRVPNVPYAFGNLALSYRGEALFGLHDSYSLTWTQNYVHEFFYRWEVLGSRNKGVVPTQNTSGIEFVYSLQNQRINLSAMVTNLFDTQVYDNFQQLRPGRTFNFKIRYLLN